MQLVDTHCHIHDHELFERSDAEAAYVEARKAGVESLLLVGTSLEDTRHALDFAETHEGCSVSVGIHPHEAAKLSEAAVKNDLSELSELARGRTVRAVGECGFDFYYNDKSKAYSRQLQLLEGQLAIAQQYSLPLSFHVREGFDEFWPVYEAAGAPSGVLHSFTDRQQHVERALANGLHIGINGIATFTTHSWQLDIFRTIPIDKIVIETDAPFLTPAPKRGTMNVPKNVIYITEFLAELRGENAEYIARATTKNARDLFGF